MLVLILVAVEARPSMNKYGTNALIPGGLRHLEMVNKCNLGIFHEIVRDRSRYQVEVKRSVAD